MRLNCRGMKDQNASSFLRRMLRTKLSPHVCRSPAPWRNVVNGMRNSAYQPPESTDVATVQVPSQLRLKPPSDPAIARAWPGSWMPPPSPSFTTCASYSMPAGVVVKTKPFCRSEEHTSELQSQSNLVCRLLLEKKKKTNDAQSVSNI